MKKMTKILSIALALAMVLGMTAFAGTPTKIIYRDDFSNYADIDAFKASRTTVTKAEITASDFATTAATYREGLTLGTPVYNHFMANPGRIALYRENGVTTLGDVGKAAWKNGDTGSMYLSTLLDEPWDVTEHPGQALIFTTAYNQYDVGTAEDAINPDTGKLIAGYRASWTSIRGLGDVYTVDAANAEGDWAGYAVDEEGNPVLTSKTLPQLLGTSTPAKADTVAGDPFTFISYQNAGTIFQRADRPFRVGEFYNISVAFLPVAGTGNYSFDLGGGGISAEGKSLRSTTLADFRFSYANDSGALNVKAVAGIEAHTASYHDIRYGDGFTFYEMSVDAADFYIDAEKTVNTNIARGDSVKIVFSQPVASGRDAERSTSKTHTYLDEQLVVTKGEEVLTLGEDFTVEINQEIEGTAVYGTVTVSPVGEWDYESDYTVTFPKGTYNIIGRELPADVDRAVTFTTEKAPTFDITITASEGLAAGGAALTADALAGKTVYFTADATNVTGRAVGGTIVIGIYDAEGNLIRYAARERDFADGEAKTFSASFKMAAGETVKAFAKGTKSELAFN